MDIGDLIPKIPSPGGGLSTGLSGTLAPARPSAGIQGGGQHPSPAWRVSIGGRDITKKIEPRLIELSLTDHRGLEADQLELCLSDTDGGLEIPPRQAEIELFLGWEDSCLIDKGTYIVDEVEHSGTPDRLSVRARSADLREGIITRKERSWNDTTIGAIVEAIAAEHELIPVVSPELASEHVAHLDETSESDANLLTRLAKRFDAVATVKSGRLLFYKIGKAESLSGIPLDRVRLVRSDGDGHRFHVADRDSCVAVTGKWHNLSSGETESTTVTRQRDEKKLGKGKARRASKKTAQERTEHSAKNTKVLRHLFATKEEAERAASAALEAIDRGISTFCLTLARGRPDLIPEQPVEVEGWKPEIDEVDWLIRKVTHKLNDRGLTSDIELELHVDESQFLIEDELKKTGGGGGSWFEGDDYVGGDEE